MRIASIPANIVPAIIATLSISAMISVIVIRLHEQVTINKSLRLAAC